MKRMLKFFRGHTRRVGGERLEMELDLVYWIKDRGDGIWGWPKYLRHDDCQRRGWEHVTEGRYGGILSLGVLGWCIR